MPDETVICKKCKTESPKGQDHCNSCGSLLPGHSFGFDKHPENINTEGMSVTDKAEKNARAMVKEDGFSWDDLDGSGKMLALAAVKTKATAADRKQYMQHVAQNLKPAPKIGAEHDQALENVIIEAEQIENAIEALATLKKFTNRQKKRK